LICFDQVKRFGIFNEKKVRNLFAKQLCSEMTQPSEAHNMAVVGIISTQLIYENFIERYHGRLVVPVVPDKVVRKLYSCSWHGARQQFKSYTDVQWEKTE
jgi:hypothetical protein